MEEIRLQGARNHNLKNINLTIPKRQLVAITGVSGSGKSSLAFDILFEEGKNQYLRSIGILAGLDNEDRFDRLLDRLVISGNSVIVIEHNIEVLQNCDYIIELRPEGGELGGEIIATGTPGQLRDNPASKTGRYLK